MSETISLDLSQRFKEAGIKIWTQSLNWLYYPTTEEIWARFPEGLVLHIWKEEWEVVIDCTEQEWRPIYTVKWPTLAEALSEMYLYLFTNGLIWKE